jgi:hypothetical protein
VNADSVACLEVRQIFAQLLALEDVDGRAHLKGGGEPTDHASDSEALVAK